MNITQVMLAVLVALLLLTVGLMKVSDHREKVSYYKNAYDEMKNLGHFINLQSERLGRLQGQDLTQPIHARALESITRITAPKVARLEVVANIVKEGLKTGFIIREGK